MTQRARLSVTNIVALAVVSGIPGSVPGSAGDQAVLFLSVDTGGTRAPEMGIVGDYMKVLSMHEAIQVAIVADVRKLSVVEGTNVNVSCRHS